MSGQFHPLRGIELLIKPKQTVQKIIEEKPGFKQGLLYAAVYAFFLGLVFVLMNVSSQGLNLLKNPLDKIISLGALLIIPVVISILLSLFASVVFRIISRILKGKGSFNSEGGVVGVVCCSIITLFSLGLFTFFVAAKTSPLLLGESSSAMLFWMTASEGLGLLIVFPFFISLFVASTEIISKIEDLEFYKSSSIFSLILGSIFFTLWALVLLFYAGLIIFTFSSSSNQSSPYDGSPALPMLIVGVIVNLIMSFVVFFIVVPVVCILLMAIIKFIASKTKKDIYLISRIIGLIIGVVILIGFIGMGYFMSLIVDRASTMAD